MTEEALESFPDPSLLPDLLLDERDSCLEVERDLDLDLEPDLDSEPDLDPLDDDLDRSVS